MEMMIKCLLFCSNVFFFFFFFLLQRLEPTFYSKSLFILNVKNERKKANVAAKCRVEPWCYLKCLAIQLHIVFDWNEFLSLFAIFPFSSHFNVNIWNLHSEYGCNGAALMWQLSMWRVAKLKLCSRFAHSAVRATWREQERTWEWKRGSGSGRRRGRDRENCTNPKIWAMRAYIATLRYLRVRISRMLLNIVQIIQISIKTFSELNDVELQTAKLRA